MTSSSRLLIWSGQSSFAEPRTNSNLWSMAKSRFNSEYWVLLGIWASYHTIFMCKGGGLDNLSCIILTNSGGDSCRSESGVWEREGWYPDGQQFMASRSQMEVPSPPPPPKKHLLSTSKPERPLFELAIFKSCRAFCPCGEKWKTDHRQSGAKSTLISSGRFTEQRQ